MSSMSSLSPSVNYVTDTIWQVGSAVCINTKNAGVTFCNIAIDTIWKVGHAVISIPTGAFVGHLICNYSWIRPKESNSMIGFVTDRINDISGSCLIQTFAPSNTIFSISFRVGSYLTASCIEASHSLEGMVFRSYTPEEAAMARLCLVLDKTMSATIVGVAMSCLGYPLLGFMVSRAIARS